jgi:hypothetical protein
MFIVTLAFGAGKPLGACWQAVALGMLGVLTGCAYFAILARMAPYYVAQAVVFALIVYGKPHLLYILPLNVSTYHKPSECAQRHYLITVTSC